MFLGTLTFAPLVIQVFYWAKLGRRSRFSWWICLGIILRVASWPMSYVVLAKGARQVAFWTELAGNVVQVGLVWLCLLGFGQRALASHFSAMFFIGSDVYHRTVDERLPVVCCQQEDWFALRSVDFGGFVGWYWPRPLMVVGGSGNYASSRDLLSEQLLNWSRWNRLPRLAQRFILFLRLAPPPVLG